VTWENGSDKTNMPTWLEVAEMNVVWFVSLPPEGDESMDTTPG